MWTKINFLTHVKTKKKILLNSYLNGSHTSPIKGDLLIYAKAFNNTGHIAVVIGLDKKDKSIIVAEQNYSNDYWKDNYSRKISYIIKNNSYWVLDQYLIG